MQAVVHQQEAHQRAGRLKTSGGVHTLEIPEYLVVGHIDTRGHIHPYAQRVRDIQAFGVGRRVARHREHETPEAEVAQADAGNILLRGDGIGHLHTRCGSRGKIGVVLKEDGVLHPISGADKAVVAIALRAVQLVGVVGAVLLLQVDAHLRASHKAVGVGDRDAIDAAARRRHHIRAPRIAVGRCAARRTRREGGCRSLVAFHRVSGDRDGSINAASLLALYNHHILIDDLITRGSLHRDAVCARLQAFHIPAIEMSARRGGPFHRRVADEAGGHPHNGGAVLAWIARLRPVLLASNHGLGVGRHREEGHHRHNHYYYILFHCIIILICKFVNVLIC